ncbi:small metal-binding protein SmbP [Methylomonas sp. MED-D]|uniref:small metal-binding protein SmbP n=1 Tax=unclassified Methylomonas TaxID=2608980 RepID=UPI0028A39728|nr:small metal-binding protein SmbP [Methylomonas sp. MV1]MDT4328469.1 small metal-binding protein SmbP [Methylomonas sp. MV1]
MKIVSNPLIGLGGAMLLSVYTCNVQAADRHFALALEHANAADSAGDVKSIVDHADEAKVHIIVIEEHMKASLKSLDAAIGHAKQGHADLAKKSSEDAVSHLNSAK